jgi:hypothetical protein
VSTPSSARPAHAHASRDPAPQLVALSTAVAGLAFDIGTDEVTIGRGESCTIIVAHPLVSRTHARVALVGGRYLLVDASSVNGTFLNGQRVVSPQVLRSGDEIGVADATPLLRFVDPEGTRSRPDQLRFDLEMQTFFFRDRTLQLGKNEFKLLLHLRANVGRVCTRESCVYAVWHTKTGVEAYRNALDQMVYQIRSKLEAIDPRCNLIQTVRGEGYLLEP